MYPLEEIELANILENDMDDTFLNYVESNNVEKTEIEGKKFNTYS